MWDQDVLLAGANSFYFLALLSSCFILNTIGILFIFVVLRKQWEPYRGTKPTYGGSEGPEAAVNWEKNNNRVSIWWIPNYQAHVYHTFFFFSRVFCELLRANCPRPPVNFSLIITAWWETAVQSVLLDCWHILIFLFCCGQTTSNAASSHQALSPSFVFAFALPGKSPVCFGGKRADYFPSALLHICGSQGSRHLDACWGNPIAHAQCRNTEECNTRWKNTSKK